MSGLGWGLTRDRGNAATDLTMGLFAFQENYFARRVAQVRSSPIDWAPQASILRLVNEEILWIRLVLRSRNHQHFLRRINLRSRRVQLQLELLNAGLDVGRHGKSKLVLILEATRKIV